MQNYANIPDHPTVLMEFVRPVRAGEIYPARYHAEEESPIESSAVARWDELEKKKERKSPVLNLRFFLYLKNSCNTRNLAFVFRIFRSLI